MGENRACVVPGGGRPRRQPAIPKLSELSTAGRAELLAIWMATLGKPPAALRTSRELLASALAWQFYPEEIEAVRLEHPEVAEAVAFAIPDTNTG